MSTFCFCGRLGKAQFLGNCVRHADKQAPKKKEKQQKFRGKSSWAKKEGFFEGAKEN